MGRDRNSIQNRQSQKPLVIDLNKISLRGHNRISLPSAFQSQEKEVNEGLDYTTTFSEESSYIEHPKPVFHNQPKQKNRLSINLYSD